MNRTVTITFDLDPEKYHEADDSEAGAIDLAIAMLQGQADFPDGRATYKCGDTVRTARMGR